MNRQTILFYIDEVTKDFEFRLEKNSSSIKDFIDLAKRLCTLGNYIAKNEEGMSDLEPADAMKVFSSANVLHTLPFSSGKRKNAKELLSKMIDQEEEFLKIISTRQGKIEANSGNGKKIGAEKDPNDPNDELIEIDKVMHSIDVAKLKENLDYCSMQYILNNRRLCSMSYTVGPELKEIYNKAVDLVKSTIDMLEGNIQEQREISIEMFKAAHNMNYLVNCMLSLLSAKNYSEYLERVPGVIKTLDSLETKYGKQEKKVI